MDGGDTRQCYRGDHYTGPQVLLRGAGRSAGYYALRNAWTDKMTRRLARRTLLDSAIRSPTTMSSEIPNKRILIGKPGLDGHDRGAKYVAHVLRDAGFEVIYTGIRRSPEQIVEAAIQEDVAAIGLSLLSGAHNVLFPRIIELLRDSGADDILVFGGGTIPPDDVQSLKDAGIAAVFTPGTPARTIVETLKSLLAAPSTALR